MNTDLDAVGDTDGLWFPIRPYTCPAGVTDHKGEHCAHTFARPDAFTRRDGTVDYGEPEDRGAYLRPEEERN